MNIDDFRYMRKGQAIKVLLDKDMPLLMPVHKKGAGTQRALLLLHGYASSPAVFRALIPQLPAYDAILCPALPGHADSLLAFNKSTANDWIKGAEDAFESLAGYQYVDVLGLSLGGLLACHLSKRFDIHHLYLLAPALSLTLNLNLSIYTAEFLRFLGFESLRNKGGGLHSQRYSELTYRRLPLNTIIEILSLVKHFEWVPPQCPTDLFLGSLDEVVNSEVVASYFDHLPQCTTHWLAQSDHVLPLDTDLDTISACIRDHFS
jgi:carboxylesterase